MSLSPEDRLIVALDVPTLAEAERIVGALGDAASIFKIGYQLFPIGGFDFAQRLRAAGKGVFIDAKLFDIGATVERGVASLRGIAATFLTVHADPDTLKGAVAGRGDSDLKILAVTVLTSWNADMLRTHGIDRPVDDLVLFRAEMAAENGADGVIASAAEARRIKARFGDRLEIITPGIRPAGADAHDQKRVVTPADAISAGADRLVVGRPIVSAAEPAVAARSLLSEIAAVAAR